MGFIVGHKVRVTGPGLSLLEIVTVRAVEKQGDRFSSVLAPTKT